MIGVANSQGVRSGSTDITVSRAFTVRNLSGEVIVSRAFTLRNLSGEVIVSRAFTARNFSGQIVSSRAATVLNCNESGGACCFEGDGCEELSLSSCESSGGVFLGSCTKCYTQEPHDIVEASGTVFTHIVATPIKCEQVTGREAHDSLGRGYFIDGWQSPEDGRMCQQFGVDGSPAIPAGFFESGSEAFSGSICLVGEPLGSTEYGEYEKADTLVKRLADPFGRCVVPSEDVSTVGIEVLALNFVNVDPVSIIVGGSPVLWNVRVDLSDIPAPEGSLTAVKTHCNGGVYTSELHVQARFTFTMVDEPSTVRVLDTGLLGSQPITLSQSEPVPWVAQLGDGLDVEADADTYFIPGVVETQVVFDCDCNGNGTRDICDVEARSPDCNENSVPDECDIAAGESRDCNLNGLPDECAAYGNGDCSCNNRIDLPDWRGYVNCLTGPRGSYVSTLCRCANLVGDVDVDLRDVAELLLRWNDE